MYLIHALRINGRVNGRVNDENSWSFVSEAKEGLLRLERACTTNRLEPGYKSVITPPLRDLAGIYALRPRALRALGRRAYIRARSLEGVL